jgi:integrase
VADYLAAQAAAGYKPSTLSRRLASINAAYKLANHPSPTTTSIVSLTLSGIRRTVGTAQRQVRPVLTEDLKRVVASLPADLRGLRDRALVLIGFAAALRRSELISLSVEDIEESSGGLVITIRRSKTDQEAAGELVGVPYGSSPEACPVRALRAWLEAAGIESGPLFRRVDKHNNVGPHALQPGAVAEIVKQAVEAVGFDPSEFAGHSLRAGLATSAAQNGANEITIMATTRHRSSQMVRRYIRKGNLFRTNAAAVAGL